MSLFNKILKEIGREWTLMLLSLFITFAIWLLYSLSLSYSGFFEYEVVASTKIEGHAPTATANEVLIVRGKGPGFILLRNKFRNRVEKINITISPELFSPIEGENDHFYISSNDLFQPLVKELGNYYEVEYIETKQLTFEFPSQTYKRVPLVAKYDISYKDQYMQVGEVKLTPDSVFVYGITDELERVKQINTKMISLYDVNKSMQGVAQIEPISGFRIAESHTTYSVEVVRYVENEATVSLDVINLPADKKLTIIPSQIKVYYRVPFVRGEYSSQEYPIFSVDYNDYIESRLGTVVPKLTQYNGTILSYRIVPSVVDCIQTN